MLDAGVNRYDDTKGTMYMNDAIARERGRECVCVRERQRQRERKRKQKDVQAGMLKDELAVWQLIEGLPYGGSVVSHERQPPTTSLAKLCLYLYLYLRVRYTSEEVCISYLLGGSRVKSQESWTSKPTVLSSLPTSCADTIKLVSNQNLFQTCNVAIAYMHVTLAASY